MMRAGSWRVNVVGGKKSGHGSVGRQLVTWCACASRYVCFTVRLSVQHVAKRVRSIYVHFVDRLSSRFLYHPHAFVTDFSTVIIMTSSFLSSRRLKRSG